MITLVGVCLGFALLPNLGSPDFACRVLTQERLERLGYPAVPAGVMGSFDADPEIRWRSREVYGDRAGDLADWVLAFWILWQPNQFPRGPVAYHEGIWDAPLCRSEVYARIGTISWLVGCWPCPNKEADWPIWRANWMVRDTRVALWGR